MATMDYSTHSPFTQREGEYLDANYGGAGGVVEDTIVDGETTKAPSQNAVFDALALKAPTANPTFTGTVAGVTKTHVGLANVDNTSDANKPVSTAQQTALDLKAWDERNLASGQSTMDRRFVTSTGVALATQSLRLTYFTAVKSETVNNVRTITGSTPAGATPTICRIGLYSVAGNGDLTLEASTANDTALWSAANTRYTKAFSAGFAVVKGNRYAIGLLVVTGATAPQFNGNNAINLDEALVEPKITAYVNSQSNLPSTVANASIVAGTNAIYSVITP